MVGLLLLKLQHCVMDRHTGSSYDHAQQSWHAVKTETLTETVNQNRTERKNELKPET